jgi:uncharacterized protein YcfJ
MGTTVKRIGFGTVIAAMAAMVSTPALARHDRGYGNDYGYYEQGNRDNYRGYRDYRGQRENRGYRNYRGQRCDKGTAGLIIGAIAGGLLGHEVVGRRGDKTAGAIIGAGVGALGGRAIDRSDGRRC